MTTLDAAAVLCELPENAVPEHGITIVSFLDEGGNQMFVYARHGIAARSTWVGLLEMISHDILHGDDD